MSLTSPDAKAVVRALDALTAQVQRLADAQQTPVDAQSTTRDDGYDAAERACPTPLTHNWGCGCPTDQAPAAVAPVLPCNWARTRTEHAPHDWEPQPGMAPVRCDGWTAEAPAADEDAQHTARRRNSILNLLDRLDRHGTLTPEERALLRNHVVDEGLEHDTARADLARYEEVQGDMNERAIDLTRRAQQAEAAIARAHKLASRWAVLRAYGSAATELRAALDGTEQPTTEA